MSSATVSVVVPCYRYGKYVTECVRSLLRNDDVGLDVLVIDDASPDDSWTVVRELPRLDPRVRVRRNRTNQGLIATANEGLGQVDGDYVVLLSADDALAPGWLDRGVAILEQHPGASFAIGPVRTFSGPVPNLHLRRSTRFTVHPGREWIDVSCRAGVTKVRSPEVITRMSAQRAVGGYRPSVPYSSDMEMWLRLATRGDVVHVRGPVAAFYRVQRASMSRGPHMHELRELDIRAAAFREWYQDAAQSVAHADSLMAQAQVALARSAVRRAWLTLLEESDDTQSMFEGLCDFALKNDPDRERNVELLRALRRMPQMERLRVVTSPAVRAAMSIRGRVPDVRARLHIL